MLSSSSQYISKIHWLVLQISCKRNRSINIRTTCIPLKIGHIRDMRDWIQDKKGMWFQFWTTWFDHVLFFFLMWIIIFSPIMWSIWYPIHFHYADQIFPSAISRKIGIRAHQPKVDYHSDKEYILVAYFSQVPPSTFISWSKYTQKKIVS